MDVEDYILDILSRVESLTDEEIRLSMKAHARIIHNKLHPVKIIHLHTPAERASQSRDNNHKQVDVSGTYAMIYRKKLDSIGNAQFLQATADSKGEYRRYRTTYLGKISDKPIANRQL